MTPQQFIAKWKRSTLSERSGSHEHFLDLCALLGQPTPAESDPDRTEYTFERGVNKSDGGHGWADVWKRDYFGWEYKGKHRDLNAAFLQLLKYREALENPPLLVVCDLDRFEVHTNFTRTVKSVYKFDLDGLADPENLDILRKVFTNPDALKPGQTTDALTKQAAELIGQVADGLRLRGIPAPEAAHFLMKLIFCMFAEDIGLLPNKVFTRAMAVAKKMPERLARVLKELFNAMAKGGYFGADEILYFNGGLFADSDVIELQPSEIEKLSYVANFDWSDVEPSIFGTLFERTLDPEKRSQIGAHYTSRDDILTLLEPVVMAPLRREWEVVKAKCENLLPKIREAVRKRQLSAVSTRALSRTTKDSAPRRAFDKAIRDFVERLAHVTVLDPACGSGNFLYVAINLLLDLEKEVIAFAGSYGVTQLPQVRPTQLAGIELNPYAQQLAQIVIWIGYLQWMFHNGFSPPNDPVLEPIESIHLMDAIIDLSDRKHPKEPQWPTAEFIVGNPPFLGGNRIRAELGDEYVDALFATYEDRLSAFSDLCCYWFVKASEAIRTKQTKRAGLLATQGIRGGVNRDVLFRIKETGDIFFAYSDRDWILDGASVHVSMVGFDDGKEQLRTLDGKIVSEINPNLSAIADTTRARPLNGQSDQWCYGSQQKAQFDIDPRLALQMLRTPNATGSPNSDVIRPSLNGAQVLRRTHESWVIDFGQEERIEKASEYEAPFEYVRKHIMPVRAARREPRQQRLWWLHARPSPLYRKFLLTRRRYIITPNSSKHRIFVWQDPEILVDHAAIVFPTDDVVVFGILHSRLHESWARAQATQVRERESGLRYTPTTCFETFPFPRPTQSQRDAIAAAAEALDTRRNAWLYPIEWVRREILEFSGSVDGPWSRYVHEPDERGIGTVRYPHLMPKSDEFAVELKKRNLTNLYNEKPTWLQLAHHKLDAAVSAAYGWPDDLNDEQILEKLLALNLQRSSAEK